MIKTVEWTYDAWSDYNYWNARDQKISKRINTLIKACKENPYQGSGSPEQLTGKLNTFWSRRIDSKHRLIYTVSVDKIIIVQCRYR